MQVIRPFRPVAPMGLHPWFLIAILTGGVPILLLMALGLISWPAGLAALVLCWLPNLVVLAVSRHYPRMPSR